MVDNYMTLVNNLYDNENHSHLRLIADKLDVDETPVHANPIITERRRTYQEQDVATIQPAQPVFLEEHNGVTTLTANQSKTGDARATIHAKPGLPAVIKPIKDNSVTLRYKATESEDNTPKKRLTGGDSAALFTPSQLVTYLKDDHPVSDEGAAHTMGREEGVTDVYFGSVPTETPDFQVTNQAAYAFRRATHHADIQLTSTTPDDTVVFDANIDHHYQ